MVSKEVLKEIIVYYQNSVPQNIVKRDVELPLKGKKIISLTGVRRCGKSYLMFDTINRLRSSGVNAESIIYINFEDERLDFAADELDLVLQACFELYPHIEQSGFWFFFDEIQNVSGWEKFLRRIYDTVTTRIFITGSNSGFLSVDIATSLRGRSLTYELFPFSFAEFLKYKRVNTDYYMPVQKAIIVNHFNGYLKMGGFPETFDNTSQENIEMLRNYFYVMLYKDLIDRYKISSVSALRFFIDKLMINVTKPFSVNRIYNELRSQGFKLDKNLLYDLFVYINNIYLAFRLPKFSYSYVKRAASDKKIYFIDNGLVNALSLVFSSDSGKLLENAVFLYLRSKFGSLFSENMFFYKNGNNRECDFIITENKKVTTAIQVSYNINDGNTLKRELAGLESAVKTFKPDKAIIITADQELQISDAGFPVEVIPAYKFFLS